jgi:hypothetical protein
LRISAWASRAACATAPSPSSTPCSRRATLQERRALRRCQRRRELAQDFELLIGQAKRLHARGSSFGRSFPRAMARSRRSQKRASMRTSRSRDHSPTISSPGSHGAVARTLRPSHGCSWRLWYGTRGNSLQRFPPAYARRRQLGEQVKFAKNWTDLIEGPLENTGTNVPRSKASGFE